MCRSEQNIRDAVQNVSINAFLNITACQSECHAGVIFRNGNVSVPLWTFSWLTVLPCGSKAQMGRICWGELNVWPFYVCENMDTHHGHVCSLSSFLFPFLLSFPPFLSVTSSLFPYSLYFHYSPCSCSPSSCFNIPILLSVFLFPPGHLHSVFHFLSTPPFPSPKWEFHLRRLRDWGQLGEISFPLLWVLVNGSGEFILLETMAIFFFSYCTISGSEVIPLRPTDLKSVTCQIKGCQPHSLSPLRFALQEMGYLFVGAWGYLRWGCLPETHFRRT